MKNFICLLATLAVCSYPVEAPVVREFDENDIYPVKIEFNSESWLDSLEVIDDEEEEPQIDISIEEVELLAQLTMAESGNQSEEGQRLVIDTVLNRVDDEHFPDTIIDVIYQPNQFSPMWDGGFERCYVKDEIVQLVYEELESRMNSDVVFFRTKHYSQYGVPMFQVGDHYFSSYD